MDIAFCIDDGYTQHCGVLMTSIFENNRKVSISIHILVTSLSEENEGRLRKITKKYGQSLFVYRVNLDLLSDCELRKGTHVSLTAYNKILIARMLPNDVERVLYLDCDITVHGSLQPLWEENIEGYSVAAVADMSSSKSGAYERLSYERELGYFNSGVMLLNLKYWREQNLEPLIFKYIKDNQHKFAHNDQDPLNYVLRDTKRFIHLRYNVMPGIYYKSFKKINICVGDEAEVVEAAKNPVILHCAARVKAWHRGALYPYKQEYSQYRNMTEWCNVKPENRHPNMVVEHALKSILYAIGVKKRRYMSKG